MMESVKPKRVYKKKVVPAPVEVPVEAPVEVPVRPPTPEPVAQTISVEDAELARKQKIKETRLANLAKAQTARLEKFKDPNYKTEKDKARELKLLNILQTKYKDTRIVKEWAEPAEEKAVEPPKKKQVFVKAIDSTDNESSDDDSGEQSSTDQSDSSAVSMPSNKRRVQIPRRAKMVPISETETETSDASARRPRRPVAPRKKVVAEPVRQESAQPRPVQQFMFV